jgi:hypothetical protein
MATSLDSPEVVLFPVLLGVPGLLRWRWMCLAVGRVILQLLVAAGTDDNRVFTRGPRETLARLRRLDVNRLRSSRFLVEAISSIVEVHRVVGERILHDVVVAGTPVLANEFYLVVVFATTHYRHMHPMDEVDRAKVGDADLSEECVHARVMWPVAAASCGCRIISLVTPSSRRREDALWWW